MLAAFSTQAVLLPLDAAPYHAKVAMGFGGRCLSSTMSPVAVGVHSVHLTSYPEARVVALWDLDSALPKAEVAVAVDQHSCAA